MCTNYNLKQNTQIIKVIMFCLQYNYIGFQNIFFNNNPGIPTGEKLSVSLANIVLHYITKNLNNIKSCYINKRYIKDIILPNKCNKLN